MSFNLPGDLTAYTQENTDLLAEAVLNTKELAHVAIRTNVPAATTTINVFTGTITEQDRGCDMSDLGDLAFDQVDITVEDKAIAQDICPTELREYWLSERMKPGVAGGEEVPFEETIVNYVAQSIQKNISDFVGGALIAQVTVAAGANDSGQTVASTASTIIGDLNDLYEALDARVQMMDDVVIFMSPSYYRMAVRAFVAANLFHYDMANGTGDVYLPGTNAKLVQSSGFIGSDAFVAVPSKYAIFATGLMTDAETIRMVYDNVNDKVALRAYYRRGLSVYSVDQCAKNGTL
jgi:hypothetical protein